MATNNMHNLTTLIKRYVLFRICARLMAESDLNRLVRRLEAATSRLEDIASSTQPFEGQAATDHHDGPSNGTSLAVPSHGQRNLHTPGASSTQLQESLPESIEDFDTLIHGDLKAYHDLSQTLSGAIEEQAAAVVGAFEAQRQFLLIATKAKKPDMSSQIYMETLKDLQEEMTRVDEIREKNRSSPQKNHLAMVADGISALAWVTIDPKPADYVIELFGGAQMYGNKVLNEQKEKYYHLKSRGFKFCRLCDKPGHDCSQVGRDTTQVEFIKSFYKLMRSLISYIKQHHVKGVQWNPQGIDAAEALRQQSTPNGAAAGFGSSAPPPPPMPAGGLPPLPGPPPAPTLGGPGKASAPDMGAVFDQLNQGEAITKGLKKVDPSQQTHKNPALRTQAPVPTRSDSQTSVGRGKSPTPPGKKPKPESMRTKKPPRKELDGNKWIIVSTINVSMSNLIC